MLAQIIGHAAAIYLLAGLMTAALALRTFQAYGRARGDGLLAEFARAWGGPPSRPRLMLAAFAAALVVAWPAVFFRNYVEVDAPAGGGAGGGAAGA